MIFWIKVEKAKRNKDRSDSIMIKHTLSDGTVRESMRGFLVQVTKETKIAYETMSDNIHNIRTRRK